MFRAKEGGENEMEHRSLASRYADLQDGKGRKRRKRESRDEHGVLNIQLAIFTDRFLLNTVGTQRGTFFLKSSSFSDHSSLIFVGSILMKNLLQK